MLWAIFGCGAVAALGAVVACCLLPGTVQNRRLRVRRINQFAFATFLMLARKLRVLDYRFENDMALMPPGQLIIANHPSLLDVVFLIAKIPGVCCVVKKTLLKNPFLALQVRLAGYIFNSGESDFLECCTARLDAGESLIIFPEGTRTRAEGKFRFRRGAAYLLMMSNAPVRPVYISCEPATLGKRDPWYFTPRHKITYNIKALPALSAEEIRFSAEDRPTRRARQVTKCLEIFFGAQHPE